MVESKQQLSFGEREWIPYHKPFPLKQYEIDMINLYIEKVLRNGELSNGRWVRRLEEAIKSFYNVDYCIATSSCTTGLMISLSYIRTRTTQIPAFNWWSDKYCFDFLGKIASWVDIDKDTWLSQSGNCNVKLILHTFGSVDDYSLGTIVYDGSHALGVKLSNIGFVTVFSLAPSKLITSCEGGLIITNDKKFAEYATEKRDKMSRMSEVNAIIGIQTLHHLGDVKIWKKNVYEYYKNNIPGKFQEIPNNSNYNTIGFLNIEGLEIPDYFDYRQYYEPLVVKEYASRLPNTFEVYDKMICLPSWYGCDYKQISDDILELNKNRLK